MALARDFPEVGLVAFAGDAGTAASLRAALASRDGRRVPLLDAREDVALFATERVVSVDTTASGGNATLLTLDEA